ncbi:MAG: OsmC family protein [Alcanivorax sp.]|uniref:OsmC family protein n=1 Tax=Alloalcanivorax marinus TaxID=1177169 RepID=A0A9Q3UM41_9GAMM|nr:OsmC family protein [Alloalcanivorax marinus]MBM7332273.1 OsmC family protein [Alloalcanivorax marinus]MCC4307528.1 OsmC family protein [Alloalcanivorax marinus]MCU5785072.1 OsmC subfamily peroxiredoxin [Alloalcanivorax marinus]
MNKFASAHWQGDIKQGKGTISTQSGALKDQPYGFNTRFEDEPGTNPEELIGGAHAGCFSMAFSLQLGNAGYTPDSIDTKAKVTLEKDGDGFSITKVHLDMTAKIPGIDDDEFQKIAKAAKEGCPVSKLLNADISLDAKLQS